MPAFAGSSLTAGSVLIATSGELAGSHNLYAARHAELTNYLKGIFNSAYVDEQMKNKVLIISRCPHCDVAIAPD